MNLSARIKKLECTLKPRERCSTCGYPRTAAWITFAGLHDTLEQCVSCGRGMGLDGRPIHEHGSRITISMIRTTKDGFEIVDCGPSTWLTHGNNATMSSLAVIQIAATAGHSGMKCIDYESVIKALNTASI